MTRQARYFKKNPWARYVHWARRRCTAAEGTKWFPFYGAKGLRVELTVPQAKALWERDGAANLKRPSLDRIDADKGYTFENCRFIEWRENVLAPHRGLGLEFCFL